MKHSKGPWYQAPALMIADSNHDYVCKIDASEGHTHHANARLIAAAPDMFDLLQSLANVDDPDSVVTESWSVTDWRNAMRQHRQACREMLAKIKGTTP